MNDQLQQTISELMQKLGTSAESFWPVYVDYTRVVHITASLTNLMLVIVGFVTLYLGYSLTRRNWTAAFANQNTTTEFFAVMAGVFMFIVGIMLGLLNLYFGLQHIPGIVVPEGQAVIDLLQAAATAKK